MWVPGRRRGFSAPHGSLQNDAKQCPCQDPLRQRPQGTRQRPKDALGASISSKRYLFCPLRLPPAEAPVRAGRAGSCDPRGDLAPPDRGGREGAERSPSLALVALTLLLFQRGAQPLRTEPAGGASRRWQARSPRLGRRRLGRRLGQGAPWRAPETSGAGQRTSSDNGQRYSLCTHQTLPRSVHTSTCMNTCAHTCTDTCACTHLPVHWLCT